MTSMILHPDQGMNGELDRIEDQMTTDWVNRLNRAEGIVIFQRTPFENRRAEAVANMTNRCKEARISEQNAAHGMSRKTESSVLCENPSETSFFDAELADLVEDDLMSVRSGATTQSSNHRGHTRSSASVANTLVKLYTRACRRRKLHSKTQIKERLALLCTDSIYDLRELDLDEEQLRPILDVIKVCAAPYQLPFDDRFC